MSGPSKLLTRSLGHSKRNPLKPFVVHLDPHVEEYDMPQQQTHS
ncbi:hypothetical protein [Rhodoligotrophos defluvii]|nr:hypothetical protein [Rhodoligotrophos defluvii]